MGCNYYFRPKDCEFINIINNTYDKILQNTLTGYKNAISPIFNKLRDSYSEFLDLLQLPDLDFIKIDLLKYFVEIPEIHICKLSCGWRPMLQANKFYSNYNEFKAFCTKYKDIFDIYDEYNQLVEFEELESQIFYRARETFQTHLDYDSVYNYKDTDYQYIEWTRREFS